MRGTPDVAYNADPETGFAVYDTYGSGGWAQFGGTSAGTPQWAALLAIANQGRALAGKDSLRNAQAALYAMPSSDFHDIQFGSNGSPTAVGYDLATGLGSPIADRLIPDLVAYNGSPDFIVAPPVSTKPPKSNRRLSYTAADQAWSEAGVDRFTIAPVVSARDLVASSVVSARGALSKSRNLPLVELSRDAQITARGRQATQVSKVAKSQPVTKATSFDEIDSFYAQFNAESLRGFRDQRMPISG
jgi:hypothetical protein